MPVYSTQCQSCQATQDRKLTYQEYDEVKAGTRTLPCSCGGSLSLGFDPSKVAFVLKDGPSGGFVSKAGKENAYRAKRRQQMAQKERDHVRPHHLIPNFEGQQVGSWQEAKEAAYQSTYEKSKSEHGVTTASKLASESAKTYDKHIKRDIAT